VRRLAVVQMKGEIKEKGRQTLERFERKKVERLGRKEIDLASKRLLRGNGGEKRYILIARVTILKTKERERRLHRCKGNCEFQKKKRETSLPFLVRGKEVSLPDSARGKRLSKTKREGNWYN